MNKITYAPLRRTYIERVLERTFRLAGFGGIRIEAAELPGKPDVAAERERIAGFAHGCYWHQHGCTLTRRPLASPDWDRKFDENENRDQRVLNELLKNGWRVVWVWECAALQYGPLVLASQIKHGLAQGWPAVEIRSAEHVRK